MQKNPLTLRELINRTFFAMLVIGTTLYVLYQSNDLRAGPILTITSPSNHTTVTDPLIEIQGEAHNIAYITLNDRQIFTDPEGVFSEELLLYPGYNILSVKVQDRFRRTKEVRVGVTLESDSLPSQEELLTLRTTLSQIEETREETEGQPEEEPLAEPEAPEQDPTSTL